MSEYAKGDITWWSHMHTPEHIHTYTDRYSCDEKQTNERKDHREAYLRTTTYMGCNHAHYVRRRIAPFLSQPSTHACMHASFHPMLGAAVVDVRAPRSRDLRSNAQRVHFLCVVHPSLTHTCIDRSCRSPWRSRRRAPPSLGLLPRRSALARHRRRWRRARS